MAAGTRSPLILVCPRRFVGRDPLVQTKVVIIEFSGAATVCDWLCADASLEKLAPELVQPDPSVGDVADVFGRPAALGDGSRARPLPRDKIGCIDKLGPHAHLDTTDKPLRVRCFTSGEVGRFHAVVLGPVFAVRDVVEVEGSGQHGVEAVSRHVGDLVLPVATLPHVNHGVGKNLCAVVVNLLPHNVRGALFLENVEQTLLEESLQICKRVEVVLLHVRLDRGVGCPAVRRNLITSNMHELVWKEILKLGVEFCQKIVRVFRCGVQRPGRTVGLAINVALGKDGWLQRGISLVNMPRRVKFRNNANSAVA
eukprot:m.61578 g.61578  ORF g.61578 m.61578 type:complete len:311 (+) comp17583_c0_seq1:1394-2326(+)